MTVALNAAAYNAQSVSLSLQLTSSRENTHIVEVAEIPPAIL